MIPHYLTTGGQRARDGVQIVNMPGRWCLYGSIGTMSHELDTGGPLDAPEHMPAGAMNSTECRSGPWHLNDGKGRAIPWQSECTR